MKKHSPFLLPLMLSILFGVGIPICSRTFVSNPPQDPLKREICLLAWSDVNDDIPRRTDFIVKLYSNNSQNLSSPDIRKIYDEEYSKQSREKNFHRMLRLAFVTAIVLICLALAGFSMKKNSLAAVTKVSVNLPFGIGSMELNITPVEKKIAWSLYIELVTRITIQPLESDQGLMREALTSLYSLFGTTRQILKEGGPVIDVSPKSVGGIAIAVLNQGLRPFLAKWHPALEEWEVKRPSTISRKKHEKEWFAESQLRSELEFLRQDLEKYAEELARIANVRV